MAIEVIRATTEYEAFIHCVANRPDVYDNYHKIDRPEIGAVKDIVFDNPEIIKTMAWVDLSERARLRIKHNDNPLLAKGWGEQNAPYGVPYYPEENLLGERMLQAETWLVTDRNELDLEFTTLTEVMQTQRLTPYALRWLGVIMRSNSRPPFYRSIDNLVTGEPKSTRQKFDELMAAREQPTSITE